MNDLLLSSISNVSQEIKEKSISPVELTEHLLRRIKKVDAYLHSYITVMEEEALAQAKQLEREIMEGKVRSPLHGVPIAIKDIIQTKGCKTTAGSKVFENWIPSKDAVVVKQLKHAGSIIIGKNNLHEFAMGATSENPHYGNVRNPWNAEKIPGGSSGGSAASVAAGLCYSSIGTDTAGSIRLPAAMCGVVGIKPTYGLVSTTGCLPFSWSLDHIGPLTRTVKDAAIMLEHLKDEKVSKKNQSFLFDKPMEDLEGVTIGICEEYLFEEISSEVQPVINQALEKLKQLGGRLVKVELTGLQQALNALKIIAQSEVLSFHRPLLQKYRELYGEDLQFRFQFGSEILAVDYVDAQRIRSQFIQSTIDTMKEIDVLVGPTNIRQPYNIGSVGPKEAISNMFTLGKTPLANILGFPALTIPCGVTKEQLPVGLQLIGKPWREKHLLQIGDCFEATQNWENRLKEKMMNNIGGLSV
jgi:aspartyl-tRNA(Asn)/glutamyl-tRNA(Gln) amidotransferase subunit A